MHIVQQRIINLAATTNLASLKLREIGELVGEHHPQKIKHHLGQLFKKGFLKQNSKGTTITSVSNTHKNSLFISLPIVGSANCGQALVFAEEYYEGYLQLSKSLLSNYLPGEFFIVKAVGNSMSRAQIKGKAIEDGDYALIDKRQKSSDHYHNKYVLSVINGMANIKKLIKDNLNEQIVLVSESNQNYPPIYIHKDDFQDYLINGEVVDIIKKPAINPQI